MSFSVSRRLPREVLGVCRFSIYHPRFFSFCVVYYSSRLRFSRIPGVVFLMCFILCLAVDAHVISSVSISILMNLLTYLTLNGLEGHIGPSLVRDGRTYMSHYCDVMVASLYRHLERHGLCGAKTIIILWSGGGGISS